MSASAHTPPRAAPRDADRLVVPLVALATLAAAALRLPFLGTQSLWFDETYTAGVVDTGSLAVLWERIGASESTPPLYYLLTWAWTQLAGDGDAALRTVSALALVAAVPVAYLALRRLAGRDAALATAALTAVSPLLTWYALDARAYGLLVLTGLLSVWACAAALEADDDSARRRRLALWALAAAATLWTHWFAGFLVAGEVVALLWLRPAARRATLTAAGAVLVALLPLAGILREQTGDDRAAFIADAGLLDRIEQLVRQFATGPNVPRTWLEAAALAVAATALVAGAWLTARRARHGDDRARALLAVAAVALLTPLALAALGIYDRFNVRNVLFAWPLAAAVTAPALLRARGAPLAALLALGVAISLWTTTDWRYGNADWRTALEHVEARDPGTPIVVVTPLGRPVATHYLERPPTAAPLAARRAWLVVEPARVPGERALLPADPPQVTPLLAAFPAHDETRVHGFRLIELSAPAAVTLDPAGLPGAAVFAPIPSGAG